MEEEEERGEGEESPGNPEDTWSPDIVGVYADRLCAVTHAFALCCSTLQKASGKYVIAAEGIFELCSRSKNGSFVEPKIIQLWKSIHPNCFNFKKEPKLDEQ